MRFAIISFAAGVFALQGMPELPPPVFGLVPCALLLLLKAWQHYRLPGKHLLIATTFLALGFAWAAWCANQRLAESLPAEWESRDVTVVGTIAELPQVTTNGERFVFNVEKVLTPAARVPGRIQLTRHASRMNASPLAVLHPGQRWQFTVRLKRPHGNANPHGFDYEAWLLERGIRATGYIREKPAGEFLAEQVLRPGHVVERTRQKIRDHFLDTLSGKEYAGILVALTIGDQRAIEGEFWQLFARTATTHLMSISGLHVTMIAALVGGFTAFLWRRSPRLTGWLASQRAGIMAGWLAALAYSFLAGFSVPAQRTLFMLSVAALALVSSRRTSPSRTMALALLLVLLLDPWAVLAPGFWLSFAAVGLLFHVASERRSEQPGWQGMIVRWGIAQWAITIGSLPLLLFFFQQFSLVSPLANAVAIPVVSLLITPLALLAAIIPVPALLHLDHLLLEWVMHFLGWLAAYPMLEVPAPTLWHVVLAIPGLIWLLLPRGFPARAAGALLLLPAISSQPPRPSPGEAWLTVLDVGHGQAIVVRTASRTLLYDSGPMYSAETNAGQRVVLPYLRALGIRTLDAMIITHADSDHAGGAASIMATLPIHQLFSPVPELRGENCINGRSWEWDGVRFSMLYPLEAPTHKTDPSGRQDRHNSQSCVLRIEAGGRSVLLTSDIEASDEKRLLLATPPEALRSDILLVPHHGSRSSSSPAFVAAVDAQQQVYSVGYRNRFGHPHPAVVARYGDRAAWRTDHHGAIEISLGTAPEIKAWRLQRPRYWHGK